MTEAIAQKEWRAQLKEMPELLKLEHSLLALPFAFMGAFLAKDGIPDLREALLISAAMVFARTAGMSFNRVLDAKIDRANPRTADRAVAAGRINPFWVWALGILCLAGLSVVAYFLNPLAFYLSFLCHILLFGYSLMKRVTWACHIVLGLVEAFAPLGGWIAIQGQVSGLTPWCLAIATIFWIAGLDIVYATQDADYDRNHRLHSIPSKFGFNNSILLARLFHVLTIVVMLVAGWDYEAGIGYYVGITITAGLFILQHTRAPRSPEASFDPAFFKINTWIAFSLLGSTLVEVLSS